MRHHPTHNLNRAGICFLHKKNNSMNHHTLYTYRCELVRVIDGDTVEVMIDLGLSVFKKIIIRLYGINAPEMKTVEGVIARDYLKYLFSDQVMNETKDWYIETYKDRKDKYGRYLGTIYPDGVLSNESINMRMVKDGHAVLVSYASNPDAPTRT